MFGYSGSSFPHEGRNSHRFTPGQSKPARAAAALPRRCGGASALAHSLAHSLGMTTLRSAAAGLIVAALTVPGVAEQRSAPLAAETFTLVDKASADADTADSLSSTPLNAIKHIWIRHIWAAELPAIKAERAELVKSVPQFGLKQVTELFTASIRTQTGTIFVSAFNHDCTFSVAAPHELFCTAKIARIDGNQIVSITTVAEFPIAAIRGPSGFAGYDKRTHTKVRFDTVTGALSYDVIHNGRSAGVVPLKLD